MANELLSYNRVVGWNTLKEGDTVRVWEEPAERVVHAVMNNGVTFRDMQNTPGTGNYYVRATEFRTFELMHRAPEEPKPDDGTRFISEFNAARYIYDAANNVLVCWRTATTGPGLGCIYTYPQIGIRPEADE